MKHRLAAALPIPVLHLIKKKAFAAQFFERRLSFFPHPLQNSKCFYLYIREKGPTENRLINIWRHFAFCRIKAPRFQREGRKTSQMLISLFAASPQMFEIKSEFGEEEEEEKGKKN